MAKTKTRDVVDALLVDLVRDGDVVLSSDTPDIGRLLEAAGKRATLVAV